MNTFKKKSLHVAVLAGLGAIGAAGTANAVHINPDGLGEVLVFPYYTVRNGNVTAMSIVNTNNETKVVKVRFLEGKNSREVLDFNLFLSPQDVWTGVVVPTATGAALESGDNSCVAPSDLFGTNGVVRLSGGAPINEFKNFQYTGANQDNANFASLDRTREGYIEVLEMGVVINPLLTGFIKHTAAGVPANCAALDAYDPASIPATVVQLPGTLIGGAGPNAFNTQYLAPPSGGLGGRASLFNAANGTNYTFTPTVLDNWFNPQAPTLMPYTGAGIVLPSLGLGSLSGGIDRTSLVFVSDQFASPANFLAFSPAGVVQANWFTSLEAVTSVFMRSDIINEFLNDTVTQSRSDWVITMPTKREFLDNALVPLRAPFRPFTNNFDRSTVTQAGACDAFGLSIYNREEGTPAVPAGIPPVLLPSPRPPLVAPPTGAAQVLCWEANVVEFGATGLLGSTNATRLLEPARTFASSPTASGATTTGSALTTWKRNAAGVLAPQANGPNGWATISFGGISAGVPIATQNQQFITPIETFLNGTRDPVARTFRGLPVIGAMFHNYTNTSVNTAFGGVVEHKYLRFIR